MLIEIKKEFVCCVSPLVNRWRPIKCSCFQLHGYQPPCVSSNQVNNMFQFPPLLIFLVCLPRIANGLSALPSLASLTAAPNSASTFAISGTTLWFGRVNDTLIYRVNILTGQSDGAPLAGPGSNIDSIVLSAPHLYAASSSADAKSVRRFDLVTNSAPVNFITNGPTKQIVFASGNLFAVNSSSVFQFSPANPSVPILVYNVGYRCHATGMINAIAVQGSVLFTAGTDRCVCRWNIGSATIATRSPIFLSEPLSIISYSTMLAIGLRSGDIQRRNVTTLGDLGLSNYGLASTTNLRIAMALNGSILYASGEEASVRRFDMSNTASVQPVGVYLRPSAQAMDIAIYSPHIFFVGISGNPIQRYIFGCDVIGVTPGTVTYNTRVQFTLDCPLVNSVTSITIGGRACTNIIRISAEVYDCFAPAHTGYNLSVVLNAVDPESINVLPKGISYSTPAIISLSPSSFLVSNTNNRVTITLDNLGDDSAAAVGGPDDVTVDFWSVSGLKEVSGQSCIRLSAISIDCQVPISQITGLMKLRVNVASVKSTYAYLTLVFPGGLPYSTFYMTNNLNMFSCSEVTAVSFRSPYLYAGCSDGSVHQYDIELGFVNQTMKRSTSTANVERVVSISADAYPNLVVTTFESVTTGYLVIFGLLDGSIASTSIAGTPSMLAVTNNSIFVSLASATAIRVWDMSLDLLAEMRGHTSSITKLLMYNQLLLSSSRDGTIRAWNTSSLTQEFVYQPAVFAAGITAMAINGSQIYVGFGSQSYGLAQLDLVTGTILRSTSSSVSIDGLSTIGMMLYSVSLIDNEISVWSTFSYTRIRTLQHPWRRIFDFEPHDSNSFYVPGYMSVPSSHPPREVGEFDCLASLTATEASLGDVFYVTIGCPSSKFSQFILQSVTVNGMSCATGTNQTDGINIITIGCMMPQTAGLSARVVVNSGNNLKIQPQFIQVLPPVIIAADSPFATAIAGRVYTNLPTDGTGRVTFAISNILTTGVRSLFVQFRAVSSSTTYANCTDIQRVSNNHISCIAPIAHAPGVTYEAQVIIGTQSSNWFPVSYGAPVLTGTDPPSGLSPAGPERIAIIGRNFGSCRAGPFLATMPCVEPAITVAGVQCTQPSVISDNRIECQSNAVVPNNTRVMAISVSFGDINAPDLIAPVSKPILRSINPASRATYSFTLDMEITLQGIAFGNQEMNPQIWMRPLNGGSRVQGTNVIVDSSNTLRFRRPGNAIPLDGRISYNITVSVSGYESDSWVIFNDYDDTEAPRIAPFNVTTSEDSEVIFVVQANVSSGNPIVRVATIPNELTQGNLYQYDGGSKGNRIRANEEITDSGKRVFFVPSPNYNGMANLTFTAQIGSLMAGPALVFLIVTPVNDPPVMTQSSMEVTIGFDGSNNATISLPATDVDDSVLTFVTSRLPTRGVWSTTMAQFSQSVITVKHDGLAGAVPYANFDVKALDSTGAITDPVRISVVVDCPAGMANNIWHKTGNLCIDCPSGAQCSQKGLFMPLNAAGYYQIDNDTYLPCEPANACLQGSSSAGQINTCAAGYTGLRCGQCGKSYYRSGQTCVQCPKFDYSPELVAFITIVAVSGLAALMYSVRRWDVGVASIAITYLQTLGILATFNLNWPMALLGIFNVMSITNLNVDLIAPECISGSEMEQTAYELKYYLTLGIPIMVGMVLLTCYIANWVYVKIVVKMTKKNYSGEASERFYSFSAPSPLEHGVGALHGKDLGYDQSFGAALASAYVWSLKFMYLELARRTFELFNCSPISTDSYFQPEPNRKCYQQWWFNMLPASIFAFLLYIIGIPILIYYLSKRREFILALPFRSRTKLDQFILEMTYKAKKEYKDTHDFWDVAIMVRKLVIVTCRLFFIAHPIFQSILLLTVLSVSAFFQKHYQPFELISLNRLEFVSLLGSVSVLFGGIMYYFGTLYSMNTEVLGVFIILLVLGFTLAVFYLFTDHIMNNRRVTRSKGTKASASEPVSE